MKKYIKLFSHIDLDGYSCNLLLEKLPVTYDATNVNYDKINEFVKEYILSEDYKNYRTTYITDISINEEVAELIENTKDLNIVLLDHHPTALWLNKYDWATVKVEIGGEKTCGTHLLFNHFQNSFKLELSNDEFKHLENFVQFVKKYDTWLWAEKYNDRTPKILNDLFYILGFERFKTAIKQNIFNIEWILREYQLILELQQEKIDKYIENKNKEIIPYTFNNHNLGVVFGEQFHSELGNKLSELNPQYDAIAIISSNGISYRTIKDDVNCGELAKLLGGGGHPKASGSRLSDDLKLDYIKSIFKIIK